MKQLDRFLKRKLVRKILGDGYVLSDQQARRLLTILDTPQKVKQIEDWLPTLAHFVRNDLTNYVGRFRRLKLLPASPSLYSLVLRYGKAEGIQRHQDYAQKRTAHFVNTTSHWINRGLDFEEAEARVKAIQTERANKAAQVLRGTSEYSIRSTAYWLRLGYTIDDAIEKVRQIQTTNGVEVYRQKGYVDAERMQNERNRKWLASLDAKDHDELRRIRRAKSHSVEGCLARGLEQSEAEATSIALYAKRKNYSRISQVCFDMVRDRIDGDGIYYKLLNHEKQFNGKNVDFFDKESGVVIEFLGDFWHANPVAYKPNERVYGRFACEIWLDDRTRFALIETHPSVRQVFIVWESEFRKNPTEVADLLAEALLEIRGTYGRENCISR